jgi:hypothetical protein
VNDNSLKLAALAIAEARAGRLQLRNALATLSDLTDVYVKAMVRLARVAAQAGADQVMRADFDEGVAEMTLRRSNLLLASTTTEGALTMARLAVPS